MLKIILILYMFCLNVNGKLKIEKYALDYLLETFLDESDARVEADDINYNLYDKFNKNESKNLEIKNIAYLANTESKIVFLIHGWMNSGDIGWYEMFRNGFMNKTENYSVIEVDWQSVAINTYTDAANGVYEVANHVGDFMVALHKTNNIPMKNFILIGHSLGAQIAGLTGKRVTELTNQKLPRIMALDPAGPMFLNVAEDERLNKNDADVVLVLHTDDDFMGFPGSVGTIDFYPNGGSNQPGCSHFKGAFDLDLFGGISEIVCDHGRSWEYFAEAIANPKAFPAKKCKSWKHFQKKLCKNITVNLGDLPVIETGKFYFETNEISPYSMV